MVSQIFLVVSLTSITIKRARCLYALLTETSIDFGSLVTLMMIAVQLVYQISTLPYRALVTRIAKHAKVFPRDLTELQPSKVPITS